jgi:hypothetical protein
MPDAPGDRRVKCECGAASIEVPWNITVGRVRCTQCDNRSASNLQTYTGGRHVDREIPSGQGSRLGDSDYG